MAVAERGGIPALRGEMRPHRLDVHLHHGLRAGGARSQPSAPVMRRSTAGSRYVLSGESAVRTFAAPAHPDLRDARQQRLHGQPLEAVVAALEGHFALGEEPARGRPGSRRCAALARRGDAQRLVLRPSHPDATPRTTRPPDR